MHLDCLLHAPLKRCAECHSDIVLESDGGVKKRRAKEEEKKARVNGKTADPEARKAAPSAKR